MRVLLERGDKHWGSSFPPTPAQRGGGILDSNGVKDPQLFLSPKDSLDEEILQRVGQTSLSRLPYFREASEKMGRLKLSQEIGVLVWGNRHGLITDLGRERLLFLQEKASYEAISAGINFSRRLEGSVKLVLDFYPRLVSLNSRGSSRRLRLFRKRRIGVGYRDKGTLPAPEEKARREVIRDSWIMSWDLHNIIEDTNLAIPPELVEGDWIDLPGLVTFLRDKDLTREQIQFLLNPL